LTHAAKQYIVSTMSVTTIRQWHSYIGVFIAPSVLFFALTGALQVFSLHEAHGDYVPFPLVEKLASVHKDQEFKMGHHHAPPAAKDAAGNPAPKPQGDDDDETPPAQLALKAFFDLVAVLLALSTAFGLWMGLKYTRRKSLAWGLFIAGAVIPLGLLLA
jgi:hypothetical protein